MMGAPGSPEMFMNIYQTTWHQIPEDEYVDVNKVFNNLNFDTLYLIIKCIGLHLSNLFIALT
jgi:hypothetical protein